MDKKYLIDTWFDNNGWKKPIYTKYECVDDAFCKFFVTICTVKKHNHHNLMVGFGTGNTVEEAKEKAINDCLINFIWKDI
jgi:hypothetical protein